MNHLDHCCVANLTHMLQTSSFNQMHVLVASDSISLFCLEGRIYIITFIKSIASSDCFIKSIASSRCVEDTLGDTLVHTLAHEKYSPAHLVSQKLRPKSKRIPCYTADGFKSSCLLFVDKMSYISMCLVLHCNATPDLYSETVTQQTLC